MLLSGFQNPADQFQYFKVVSIVVISATWPFKLSFLGAHFFHLGKWNCLPNLENQEDFKLLFTKKAFQSLLCLGWQFVRYPHRSWRPVCLVFFKLSLFRCLILVCLEELVLNPPVNLAVLLQKSHPTILLEVIAHGRCVSSIALKYFSLSKKIGKAVFDSTELYWC